MRGAVALEWEVRNAANLCFAALVSRIVGYNNVRKVRMTSKLLLFWHKNLLLCGVLGDFMFWHCSAAKLQAFCCVAPPAFLGSSRYAEEFAAA